MHGVGEDPHPQRGLVGRRADLDPDRQQDQRDVTLEVDLVAQQLFQPVGDAGVGQPQLVGQAELGRVQRLHPIAGRLHLGRVGAGVAEPVPFPPGGRELAAGAAQLGGQRVPGGIALGDGGAYLVQVGHQGCLEPVSMLVARKAARAGSWNSR